MEIVHTNEVSILTGSHRDKIYGRKGLKPASVNKEVSILIQSSRQYRQSPESGPKFLADPHFAVFLKSVNLLFIEKVR